jgi:ABC-type oligopeptide transport system substrate-binding subunit
VAARLQPPLLQYHRVATSPYPPGSWACDPGKSATRDLYNQDRAKGLLHEAQKENRLTRTQLTLRTIYPKDDPRIAGACQEMARQLAELGKSADCPLRLQLVGLDRHEFQAALQQRNYDLAYHHLDYENEAYWLWPLFNPRAPEGASFLNYRDDSELQELFGKAQHHREFAKVREWTHAIDRHLHERMPLIPLWQLDTHLAVRGDLSVPHLDPLRVFLGVAEWQLK